MWLQWQRIVSQDGHCVMSSATIYGVCRPQMGLVHQCMIGVAYLVVMTLSDDTLMAIYNTSSHERWRPEASRDIVSS